MKKKIKIAAIIEARLGSKRLPRKLLIKTNNKPILKILIDRVKRINQIDDIIIATSNQKIDDELQKFAKKNKIRCFRGSEENVLQRVTKAASKYNADAILQVSGDSIFLDSEISDQMISIYKKNKVDVVVDYWNSFPSGINATILSKKALNLSMRYSKNIESVSDYIFKNTKKFKTIYYYPKPSEFFPNLNLCLDEYKDLLIIKKFINSDKKNNYTCSQIVSLAKKNLNWLNLNSSVKRRSKKNI